MVKVAQIESWKRFCGKQDKEGVWEGIYRVIGRTTKRKEDLPLEKEGKIVELQHCAKLLAETFYPYDSCNNDSLIHTEIREKADRVNGRSHAEHSDPPFTMKELRFAVESFNPKKAPGADGFTADICREAIFQDPEFFLSLMNKCLELEHFPTPWKEATVVVLRKPGKDNYMDPKAHRPIGLLPVMGKILEKLVIERLKWHILPNISTRQYGFMPQKSTEDSLYDLVKYIRQKLIAKKVIVMISLDIEGAFDNAWWPAIRVRLAEEGCPINLRRILDSYLKDRKVTVRYGAEQCTRTTNKGCVQGSIGGPILWNLLLDPLLKDHRARGDYCQAFADDVVLVFDGDTGMEVQRQANSALAHVQEWGVSNKLRFAPLKTKAMVITNKLKYDAPLLSMGGVAIEMSREIKILGLIIDDKLTFNSHVKSICKKVQVIYKQLSRAAKISWGLHPEVTKTIYNAVVEPVILYAASAWAPAANKLGVRKQLKAVQRGFAQKIIKAYRTVSLNSALILSGLLPLDIRVKEASDLFEAKRGALQEVLGDREVEPKARFTTLPHPAERLNLHFTILACNEQAERHNSQDLRIYTDGSKIEGKVGAALSLWNNGAETKALKLKLAPYCSVYQAELLALYRAAEIAAQTNEKTIGIYSDSRSSLESIVGYSSLHPIVIHTRDKLRDCQTQNKEVSLFWVKAHVGMEGNERADVLAKEAALTLKKKPDYDLCPISFVKRQIRDRSLREWNSLDV